MPEEKKEKKYSQIKNDQPQVRVMAEDEIRESQAIVPVKEFSKPIVSVKEALEAFEQYQGLIKSLIKSKDVQKITTKNKKTGEVIVKYHAKKVGINKLARFFGISVEIIKTKDEERIGPQGGKIFISKTWAKAVLPNGQFRVAGGACSSGERMFARLYNDVTSTSETRAKKRAIEEVIGMGELELSEDIGRDVEADQIKEEGQEAVVGMGEIELDEDENRPKEEDKGITPEQKSEISAILMTQGKSLAGFNVWLKKTHMVENIDKLTESFAEELLRGLRPKKYPKSLAKQDEEARAEAQAEAEEREISGAKVSLEEIEAMENTAKQVEPKKSFKFTR